MGIKNKDFQLNMWIILKIIGSTIERQSRGVSPLHWIWWNKTVCRTKGWKCSWMGLFHLKKKMLSLFVFLFVFVSLKCLDHGVKSANEQNRATKQRINIFWLLNGNINFWWIQQNRLLRLEYELSGKFSASTLVYQCE